MRPLEIFQGMDQPLVVQTNIDLTSATEIDFRIDTNPQITKTLSASDITNLTASQFQVTIAAADTATVKEGVYKFQLRATIGGLKHTGRFTPNKLVIRDSVHETEGSGQDYGNDP